MPETEKNGKKYRLFVKRRGCIGKSCRICEQHIPGFFSEHNGDFHFSAWVMLDKEASRIIDETIQDCPAAALGWEEVKV